jgi:hypothetical protein
MDMDDIRELRDECDRAVNKAERARIRIADACGFEAIIPGEETNEMQSYVDLRSSGNGHISRSPMTVGPKWQFPVGNSPIPYRLLTIPTMTPHSNLSTSAGLT